MSDEKEDRNTEGMNVIEDMGKGFKSEEGWTGKDQPEESAEESEEEPEENESNEEIEDEDS